MVVGPHPIVCLAMKVMMTLYVLGMVITRGIKMKEYVRLDEVWLENDKKAKHEKSKGVVKQKEQK